jgi:gentisate 1,2-dioxygenase
MVKKDDGRNRTKEDVRKRGGIFNIHEGFNWTKSTDLDVHLVLTPRVGSHNIGITSGVHTPGMEFEPHIHPLSEELVFCHDGEGEFFLYDRWFPVKKGDVLYAPPGVRHGTRKPADQEGIFVTIGVASPPQLDLYNRIGYDPLGEDSPEAPG